jgi:uncharacterized membrane protein
LALPAPAFAALTTTQEAQAVDLSTKVVGAIKAALAQAKAQNLTGDAASALVQIAVVSTLQDASSASPAVRLEALQLAQNQLMALGELSPTVLAALTAVTKALALVSPTSTSAFATGPSPLTGPSSAGAGTGGSDYRTH